MLLQPEDPAIIGANAFENPIPIQQPVIQHGDPRVTLAVKLAIDVDDHAVKLIKGNDVRLQGNTAIAHERVA